MAQSVHRLFQLFENGMREWLRTRKQQRRQQSIRAAIGVARSDLILRYAPIPRALYFVPTKNAVANAEIEPKHYERHVGPSTSSQIGNGAVSAPPISAV
jgi:hypothetical protein